MQFWITFASASCLFSRKEKEHDYQIKCIPKKKGKEIVRFVNFGIGIWVSNEMYIYIYIYKLKALENKFR